MIIIMNIITIAAAFVFTQAVTLSDIVGNVMLRFVTFAFVRIVVRLLRVTILTRNARLLAM